ncbi:MAG: hypothetical protein PHR92_02085 [Lachnospiraceae bacterium]|nr:hypothetical protein [Lachnospiraceae bacterium]
MKERMKKVRNIFLHILFLLVLFLGAVLAFSRMINQVTPDVAETMANSTFPLVYMQKDGVNYNCLHGYSREMDVTYIRDSITPLESNRELNIQIQAFSATIDSVSYEVISLDGTESLENTKVVKLEKNDDYLNATLSLQNKMYMNQEYMLKIQITSGGRDIYYYTHVLLADGLHTKDYLNYVSGFYDKCINGTDQNTIGAAVEPDETTDEEATLAFMDIHDSVAQLTWANLKPQIYYKPIPRLMEINENTATLTLDYRIASTNTSGVTEVFNVHEYYRVRYTDSRVFLLNFERTTDEIFNPENNVLSSIGINLGITDKNVEYASDEKNRIIAFVQEDELWTYDISSGKLTQVFSFPQKENIDYRDFYDQNEIKILRVSTDGDIWFSVNGYMNRGTHEGENGVAVYYYEGASSMVDEKIFISSMETADKLQKDVDSLSYISADESKFYVMLEGTVYRVDLNSRLFDSVVTDVKQNCHGVSASGQYFSWLKEGEEYGSGTLCVIDLETESVREITCGSDEFIRPVGFMKEDVIYGIAKKSDVSAEHGGNGIFPMYRLVIEDSAGTAVKTYEPTGFYVTDTWQSDNMLTLTRMTKSGEGFAEAAEDHIVNTDTEDSVALGTATRTSDRKQTEVVLRVGTTVSTENPQVVRSKIITYDTSRTLEIPVNYEKQKTCFVYSAGKLDRIFANVNEAIVYADEKMGVVVDSLQNYVWVRGDKGTTAKLEVTDLPAVVVAGTTDLAALESGIGKTVVDLSGCTLDEVLYFVSHGRPVIAMTADGPVTIVGYDEYNTYLLDPNGTEWYYAGMNDSKEMFEGAGNVFISYLD